MIISTKNEKIEFGREAKVQYNKQLEGGTYWNRSIRSEGIKMIPKEKEKDSFFGYKNINYNAQNMKEFYKEINKMLGGN